jgi:hypothetical protein
LNSSYVKGDVTQQCLGIIHKLYIETLLVPALSISMIIGAIMYILLEKKKQNNIGNDLNSVKMLNLFGMIFKEYKPKFCNFEIAKLYMKVVIVIIINVLE